MGWADLDEFGLCSVASGESFMFVNSKILSDYLFSKGYIIILQTDR